MTSPTFVTVGAGQTAAVAARTLRRRGFDGRIVLVGDEPHAPYQRPPLSKEFLAGSEDRESLLLLPADVAGRQRRRDRAPEPSVDRASTRPRVASNSTGRHRLVADAVLFATGGRPAHGCRCPDRGPELVHYLRTLDDAAAAAALADARSATRGRSGAGFIGLEVAATASTLGADVTVVEAAPSTAGRRARSPDGRRVRRSAPPTTASTCAPAQRSSRIRTTADGVVVELADARRHGRRISSWSASASTPNVAVGRRIRPARSTTGSSSTRRAAPSIPQIFTPPVTSRAGTSDRAGRHVRVEHFDNANKQGAAAANAMLGRDAVSDDATWFWSDQYGQQPPVRRAPLRLRRCRRPRRRRRPRLHRVLPRRRHRQGAFAIDRGEDVMAVP